MDGNGSRLTCTVGRRRRVWVAPVGDATVWNRREFQFIDACQAKDPEQCVRLLLGMTLWLPVMAPNNGYVVTERDGYKLVHTYTSRERAESVVVPGVDLNAPVSRHFVELVESWKSTEYGLVVNPDSDSELHILPEAFPDIRKFAEQHRVKLFAIARTRDPVTLPVTQVGEFRFAALADGFDDEGRPAILPARRMIIDLEEKAKMRGYLQSGAVLQAVAGRAQDMFDPDRGEVVPASTLTDGIWVWQEGMVYYLEKYGLAPEPEFLNHIVAAGYRCPEVPSSRLEAAGRALMEWQRATAKLYRRSRASRTLTRIAATDEFVPPASRWLGQIVRFEPPLLRTRYPYGVYVNLRGCVDWIPYARAIVELPEADEALTADELRVLDVLTANAVMVEAQDPLWAGTAGSLATPDGWLWRHLPYSRQVALVPAELAVAFRHAGGIATRLTPHPGRGVSMCGTEPVGFEPVPEQAEVDVDRLETSLGVPVPEPYRDFLIATGGGRPTRPAVHPDFGFVVDQTFLHAARGRRNLLNNLRYLRPFLGDRFTNDFLGIARVQGGMLALRLTDPDAGSVWFWDADDFHDDDRYDAVIVCRDLLRRCADSFDVFLRQLVPVPEWLCEVARSAVTSGAATVVRDDDMGKALPAKDRPSTSRS